MIPNLHMARGFLRYGFIRGREVFDGPKEVRNFSLANLMGRHNGSGLVDKMGKLFPINAQEIENKALIIN